MRGYAILVAAVVAVGLPAAALAQPSGIDIGVTPRDPSGPSPPNQPPGSPYGGEVIEVDSGDVETIWFHVVDGEGSLWHLKQWYVDFDVVPSHPEPPSVGEVLEEWAQTSIEYPGCSWIPLVDVKVEGPPCTMFNITVTVDFGLVNGVPVQHTETIIKHIIPEPASFLLLGVGAFGLLPRRRRS